MILYAKQTRWATRIKPGAKTGGIHLPSDAPKPTPCVKGTEIKMGSDVCPYIFVIEEVEADSIVLAFLPKNEKYAQKWTLHIGETVTYRSRSVDAGFNFSFTLE